MTELDAVDRQRLVALLAAMPALESERSRAHVLALAGAPVVDVSGRPADAVGRIVHYLTEYGRVPGTPHALGVFLNVVKGFSAEQDFLADLLTRYDLATPVAEVPAIGAWRGAGAGVFGEHPPWPVAFLNTAVEVAACVASVHVATGRISWSGTGFLVGPDVLLTAGHVLPSPDLVPHTMFRFGDQAYTSRDDGLFHANLELDYTLVQLGGRARDRWLPLTAETVAVGDRVSVVHQPGGLPTRISLGDNVVEYAGGSVTQYSTTSSAMSSGAPVLTDEWRVCAVHHASAAVVQERLVFRNEGVTTAAILRDLPAVVRRKLPA